MLVVVFIINLVSLAILFKYIFKAQFNFLTFTGILIVGSFIGSFFDGRYYWIGPLAYAGLVSFAFYKKFHLSPSQIFITMVVLLTPSLLWLIF